MRKTSANLLRANTLLFSFQSGQLSPELKQPFSSEGKKCGVHSERATATDFVFLYAAPMVCFQGFQKVEIELNHSILWVAN